MTEFRNHSRFALWVVCALPLAAFAGSDSIDRKVAADATGEVVISNVAGTIDVRGWDRNEIQVTGTMGRGVERIDVDSSNGRTVIKVVLPHGSTHDGDADHRSVGAERQQRRSIRSQCRCDLARRARHAAAQECER